MCGRWHRWLAYLADGGIGSAVSEEVLILRNEDRFGVLSGVTVVNGQNVTVSGGSVGVGVGRGVVVWGW